MKAKKNTREQFVSAIPIRLIASFAFISVVSIGLMISRIAFSSSLRYTFLFWNIVLALIPALLAWWLVWRVKQSGWLKWQQIVLTVLWVVFLPNSFYIITDLIHLRANYEADILFDVTLLASFIVAGLLFGYTSVYLVHRELLKRLRERSAYGVVALLFLVVSFAICLGRYLRWNTWDILLRPAGLLFDVSDRVINADSHVQTYETTLILFLVLFSGYTVVYEAARQLKANK
jgi:uncharacterized membrane protein